MVAVVVDDHRGSIELATYLLEHAGFEVKSYANGAQALIAITAEPPDVIVLDLALPGMDGCDLRNALATDPTLARIPIVVTSVHGVAERCPGLTDADFACCVRKPINPATFAATVRSVVS